MVGPTICGPGGCFPHDTCGPDGVFWANLEMDLQSGRFVEKEQLLPTPASLYHMSDPQWMADHLRDDLALQLSAYIQGFTRDLDRRKIARLAQLLDFPFDWTAATAGMNDAGAQPLTAYARTVASPATPLMHLERGGIAMGDGQS